MMIYGSEATSLGDTHQANDSVCQHLCYFRFATSRLIAEEVHFIGSLKSWRLIELFEKEFSLAELSAINLAGCGFSHASFLKENHALLDQYLRYPMRYASRGFAQNTRTYFYLLRIRESPGS